jgi:uncharacterized membrane protein YqjE
MSDPSALLSELSKSGKGLFGTILAMLHNRLELIALELKEEKLRIVSILVWTGLALLFLMLAVVLGTFTIAFLLDGTARTVALLSFTVFYLICGIAALAIVRRTITRAIPFAQTLAELKKDRETL